MKRSISDPHPRSSLGSNVRGGRTGRPGTCRGAGNVSIDANPRGRSPASFLLLVEPMRILSVVSVLALWHPRSITFGRPTWLVPRDDAAGSRTQPAKRRRKRTATTARLTTAARRP